MTPPFTLHPPFPRVAGRDSACANTGDRSAPSESSDALFLRSEQPLDLLHGGISNPAVPKFLEIVQDSLRKRLVFKDLFVLVFQVDVSRSANTPAEEVAVGKVGSNPIKIGRRFGIQFGSQP